MRYHCSRLLLISFTILITSSPFLSIAFTLKTSPTKSFTTYSNYNNLLAEIYKHSKHEISRRSSSCILLQSKGEEEDDDGWREYNVDKVDSSSQPDVGARQSITSNRKRELATLRSEIIDAKNINRNAFTTSNEEGDRDLFIPIFAIVSLIGLFGAYGYEMLRLYSRGELYLPGSH